MRTIKVLVANRPRLMRELVMATISEQPDIEVVGVIEDEASIAGVVEQSRPDVLIIALDRSGDRPHICDQLLDRFPHLGILALAPERNNSMYYWASLDIRSNKVETSEDGILSGGIRINVHYDQKAEWVEKARRIFRLEKEEVFAVGDSSGDIPLFQACGFSIAFNCHSPQAESIATVCSPEKELRNLIPILTPYLGSTAKPERF